MCRRFAGPRACRVKILPREKKMASDEKVFNTKVVRNVETVNFAIGVIFIRGRLWPVEPKNRTAISDIPKSVVGYYWKDLDVIWSPLLVREVQPPLIYVGGNGRLNNTQSNKSIYYFFSPRFIPPSFFSLVLRCSSSLRAVNTEALVASEST
jgi:hypothetical protein